MYLVPVPARRALVVLTLVLRAIDTAAAQPPGVMPDRTRGCARPASERRTEVGCYTTTETPLGPLPAGKWFWHIQSYATRAEATAARGPRSTVVEVQGRVWLYTIAEEAWQPAGGRPVATIGPLDVTAGDAYTARYLEAVFTPDLDTNVMAGHRHPGSEAWYVLSGMQCLETPNGLILASAGNAALVPEGWPMSISSVGPHTRRALVLVLHRSSEPYAMPVDHQTHHGAPFAHWRPKGLCPQ